MNEKLIFIASDHAAVELKEKLKSYLLNNAYQVQDLGTNSSDSVDYPSFAHELAKQVLAKQARGVLLCGSGIGMSIAANRHRGIRAALCTSVEYASLARKHNDSNVLVLGARFTSEGESISILETWLNTVFEAGRHQKRVNLIEEACQ